MAPETWQARDKHQASRLCLNFRTESDTVGRGGPRGSTKLDLSQCFSKAGGSEAIARGAGLRMRQSDWETVSWPRGWDSWGASQGRLSKDPPHESAPASLSARRTPSLGPGGVGRGGSAAGGGVVLRGPDPRVPTGLWDASSPRSPRPGCTPRSREERENRPMGCAGVPLSQMWPCPGILAGSLSQLTTVDRGAEACHLCRQPGNP